MFIIIWLSNSYILVPDEKICIGYGAVYRFVGATFHLFSNPPLSRRGQKGLMSVRELRNEV